MINESRRSQQKIQVTKDNEIQGYRIVLRLGSARFIIPDDKTTLYGALLHSPNAPAFLNLPTPTTFEKNRAEDYMQREAEKIGGNAVINFHWETETIRVPKIIPGGTDRQPFADHADPRNILSVYDRIIQRPSLRV